MKAAAPYQQSRRSTGKIAIRPHDLRKRLKERRSGHAILFLIDASASMRNQDKIIRVKGMVRSFFNDIYLKRDKVALVAFRHTVAELVLPFTHNLTKAKARLDKIPIGGKTPLAEGLVLAFKTLRREIYQNQYVVPLLIVLSDGKPNASMREDDPLEEALAVADHLRRNRIQSLFIDTETNPLVFGYAPDIAHALGGKYINISKLI